MRLLLALDFDHRAAFIVTAMWADGTIGPTDSLKGFAGLGLVLEDWVLKISSHRRVPFYP